MRRLRRESLNRTVTLPLPGTVNVLLAKVAIRLRPRLRGRTRLTVFSVILPLRPAPAVKLNRKRPVRLARIERLERLKLALAGGVGAGGAAAGLIGRRAPPDGGPGVDEAARAGVAHQRREPARSA